MELIRSLMRRVLRSDNSSPGLSLPSSLGLPLPPIATRATSDKCWPKDVMYLNGLCVWNNDKTFEGYYGFDPVNSAVQLFHLPRSHAAWNDGTGLGVRATASIPVGMTIGYYAGEYYHQPSYDEFDESNSYVMEPYAASEFVYDGKCLSNEMRFINDPRGISPWPNVMMGKHVQMKNAPKGVTARPIITIREIEEGQEILMDYGPEYWNFRGQNTNYAECAKCCRILDRASHFSVRGRGYRKRCNDCSAKYFDVNVDEQEEQEEEEVTSSSSTSDKIVPVVACTKCAIEFEQTAENFHRNRYSKSGFRPACKKCTINKPIANVPPLVVPSAAPMVACKKCSVEFEQTSKNFYVRNSGFHSACKKCHNSSKKTTKKSLGRIAPPVLLLLSPLLRFLLLLSPLLRFLLLLSPLLRFLLLLPPRATNDHIMLTSISVTGATRRLTEFENIASPAKTWIIARDAF
jgi:hypothetical protein